MTLAMPTPPTTSFAGWFARRWAEADALQELARQLSALAVRSAV
jgi:hypothetical protein